MHDYMKQGFPRDLILPPAQAQKKGPLGFVSLIISPFLRRLSTLTSHLTYSPRSQFGMSSRRYEVSPTEDPLRASGSLAELGSERKVAIQTALLSSL